MNGAFLSELTSILDFVMMARMRRFFSCLLFLFIFPFSGCTPAVPDGMVFVPSGEFVMGTNETRLEDLAMDYGIVKPWVMDAVPERRQYLSAFYLDRFEITNAKYFRFVQAENFPILPHWPGGRPSLAQENLPVVFVDWEEADAYCRWAGKRLPTEGEWEKAARGPDGWIYPWGVFFDTRRANIGGLHADLKPVGSFPLGGSPYGAMDMIGNAWEWTAEEYLPYPGASFASQYYGRAFRVVRGNSFAGIGHFPPADQALVRAAQSRAAYRMFFAPNIALRDIGFRCARDFLDPV